MTTSSWIHALFFRPPPSAKSRHAKRRVRLGCQQLEDRVTPTTFVVDLTTDEDNGNVTAGDTSLREAIKLANTTGSADTITFSPTVFATPQTIPLTLGRMTISQPLTIIGPGADLLTLDANYTSQIFYVDGGALANVVNIEGLTMKRGYSATIPDPTFNGGALSAKNAVLTLRDFTVTTSQTVGYGGGLYLQNTPTTLLNGVIQNAFSPIAGGGIYALGSNLTLTNMTIARNSAKTNGGGIYRNGGYLNVTNSTITLNSSNANNDSEPNTNNGGGIYSFTTGTKLFNTIVANNHRGSTNVYLDDLGGFFLIGGSTNNLILNAATAGGLTNGASGNIVGFDPLLGALTNNGGRTQTYALGQNSPALGAGSATVLNYVPYDQRGTARDVGTPDIGAYEVQHPLATVGAPTDLARLYAPKPSATTNEAFVKGLYQSTLLRAPEPAGLQNWLAALDGGLSRSAVAYGFVNSTENRTNQVTFFYKYFLNRNPDAGGLNNWVQALQAGTDEGAVITNFILSAEFSAQNNNTQFVNLMYYALLSRQADAAGFNNWLNLLNSGASRATVVNGFLRSTEGINRVVNSLFQTYLKRYPDGASLSNFFSYLDTHTFGQVATLILQSDEFYNNAAANR